MTRVLSFEADPLYVNGTQPPLQAATFTGTVFTEPKVTTPDAVPGEIVVQAGGQNFVFGDFEQTMSNGVTTLTGINLIDGKVPDPLVTFTLSFTSANPPAMIGASTNVLGVHIIVNPNVQFTDNPLCFAEGTLIRTVAGEVAIERLSVGDLIVTASGKQRPVKWTGQRTIDCAAHPRPDFVIPVMICAGAFGNGLPTRDLIVSPHHGIAVQTMGAEEVFIPAMYLINDRTITRLGSSTVTYWHVELDQHDVIYANGLGAESYIDVGNRNEFENEGLVVLYPTFFKENATYCRPLVTQGGILSAARSALAIVADKLSKPQNRVAIFADGVELRSSSSIDAIEVSVPANVRELRLVSPVFCPFTLGQGSDKRTLGVLINSIEVDHGEGWRSIALDDKSLSAGFHVAEAMWRWTSGNAHFAVSSWGSNDFTLRLRGRFDLARANGIAEAA